MTIAANIQCRRDRSATSGTAANRVPRKPKIIEFERSENVFDTLTGTPEEAANLNASSDIMVKLVDIIKAGGWTQAEAANRCHVTKPRMNDLLRGRISRFSLGALVNIAAALGQKIHVELKAA
jgi:predicted XRE-type DNA-binding protein